MEKNNDDARRNYFSSNKWDGPKEILLTETRLEKLRQGGHARNKRSYIKVSSHWTDGIYQCRKRARYEEPDEPETNETHQLLSHPQPQSQQLSY